MQKTIKRSRWFVLLSSVVTLSMMTLLFTVQSALADGHLPVVDDFEEGIPEGFVAFADSFDGSGSSTSIRLEATETALPSVPVPEGNKVASTLYHIASEGSWGGGPGYAGVSRDFDEPQDWSSYTGLSMWIKGSNTGGEQRIELKSAGDAPGASNRYVYSFMDDAEGWRLLHMDFSDFVERTDFNPGPEPAASLNLSEMWGYSVLLAVNTGTMEMDHVVLTNETVIHDFNEGVPEGFVLFSDAFDGTGSATTIEFVDATMVVPTVPITGSSIEVNYNVATEGGWDNGPGYAGTSHDFAEPQDWSDQDGIQFWFRGSNTGSNLRIELKADGDGPANSNRYEFGFMDNSDQWRLFTLPFSSFVQRTDFNPGPSPTDPLNLSAIWGYSILLMPGAGTMAMDHLVTYGAGEVELAVALDEREYDVEEGDELSVMVKLNLAPEGTVTVNYATADGTATAGEDYTEASGTLTFEAGVTEQTITIVTMDDGDEEDHETLTLTLSDANPAILGNKAMATITILDNDAVAPNPFALNVDIVDDFEGEFGDGSLPSGEDAAGVQVGFITWSDGSSVAISKAQATEDSGIPPFPGQAADAEGPNTVVRVDADIASWGGFSHAFSNEETNAWIPQDWSGYAAFSFWLHGNNTGNLLFIDIQDNRNPGATTDDAERWTYEFRDDVAGWRYVEIPFSAFNRKEIGNGAPSDDFARFDTHAWAFGMLNSGGPQTYYLDNVGVIQRTMLIDDFEIEELASGKDANDLDVGFITWSDGSPVAISLMPTGMDDAAPPLPGIDGDNQVLAFESEISQWGGFTHVFANDELDTWETQDWRTYEGISFWIHGGNTGSLLFMDILDNRNPGSTSDDAERWFVEWTDDFEGWRYVQFPFSNFNRKDIGNGAPDDGFGRTEIHGWALGSTTSDGPQTHFIDQVMIYGNNSIERPFEVQFMLPTYQVNEDAGTATLTVSLTEPRDETITVDYATEDRTATTDRDYTPTSGTLTFEPGDTEQSFTVTILEDVKDEGAEAVWVQLSNLTGPEDAMLGGRDSVRVVIVDNDEPVVGIQSDFETYPYLFTVGDGLTLSITEIAPDSEMALPDQSGYEGVLTVDYDLNAGSGEFGHTFAQSQDWSAQEAVSFWFNGANNGNTIEVTVQDNRQPDPGPEGWTLVWSDEFDTPAGTPPNPKVWTHEIGDMTPDGKVGWGNGELEYYTDSTENSATDGEGNLVITAREIDQEATPMDCYYGPCEYTSARLITMNKYEVAYGRVEARIRVPFGQGIWPAFWMLGNNISMTPWPDSGEIDIMENIGREPNTVHGTLHGPGYSGGNGVGGGYDLPDGANVADDFHIFAIEWEPERIRWFIDDVNYFTATPDDLPEGSEWVYDHPFFIILNVAVGGNWPGVPDETTTFPQTMHIDYLRVYQAEDTAERFTGSFVDDTTGWRHINIPFNDMSRDADQPANAPDDGFGLSEVWGYSLTVIDADAAARSVDVATGTFHMDQVATAQDIQATIPPNQTDPDPTDPTALEVTEEPVLSGGNWFLPLITR
ncbi:MAG: carbohydrate binding domain-containing protein [Chloroflexota bacterium]